MTSATIFRDICLTNHWFRIKRNCRWEQNSFHFSNFLEQLPRSCLYAFSYLYACCSLSLQDSFSPLQLNQLLTVLQDSTYDSCSAKPSPAPSVKVRGPHTLYSHLWCLMDEWTNWLPDTLNFIEFETGKQGYCGIYSSN